ncbi:hypothetical protein BJ508DRAFT_416756 [Ascobolus immersus RN42]|uniref:Uncharacterized protein n=1 Tax=Ascobolus immersus RN42 TaxID=1160509 RepID=A0A3N4I8B0_ASCIM|nr:hypothetical protein BJ508DRAFT_416756 [Ascobolus immersus RN42]
MKNSPTSTISTFSLPSPTFPIYRTPLPIPRRRATKKHHYSSKPSILSPTSLLQIPIPDTSLVTVQSFPTPHGSTFTLMTAVITPLPALPPTDPLPPTPRHSSESEGERKRVMAKIRDLNRRSQMELQERRKLRRVGRIPRPVSIYKPNANHIAFQYKGLPTPPGSGSPRSSVFNTVVRSPIGVKLGGEDTYFDSEDEAQVDELLDYDSEDESSEGVEVDEIVTSSDDSDYSTEESDNEDDYHHQMVKHQTDQQEHQQEQQRQQKQQQEEETDAEEEEQFFTPMSEFAPSPLNRSLERISASAIPTTTITTEVTTTSINFNDNTNVTIQDIYTTKRTSYSSLRSNNSLHTLKPQVTASSDLADLPDNQSMTSTPPRTPPADSETSTQITVIHSPQRNSIHPSQAPRRITSPIHPALPQLALIPPTPMERANPLAPGPNNTYAVTTIDELHTYEPLEDEQDRPATPPERPGMPQSPTYRQSKLHPFWAPRRPSYLSRRSGRGVRRSVVFEEIEAVRDAEGSVKERRVRKRYRVEFVGLGGCWRVFVGGRKVKEVKEKETPTEKKGLAKALRGSMRGGRRLSRTESRSSRGKRESVHF